MNWTISKERMVAAYLMLALVVVGVVLFSARAEASEDTTVVTWQINTDITEFPSNGSDDIWDPAQSFYGYGHPDVEALPCETYFQVDTYHPGHPFGPGSTLTGPKDDAKWIKSWYFVYGGDCEPEPETRTVTGEAVSGVGECVGNEFVTTTTTEPWKRTDTKVDGEWVEGERVYGEATITTTSAPDEACVIPDDPEPPTNNARKAQPAAPVVAEATYTG